MCVLIHPNVIWNRKRHVSIRFIVFSWVFFKCRKPRVVLGEGVESVSEDFGNLHAFIIDVFAPSDWDWLGLS